MSTPADMDLTHLLTACSQLRHGPAAMTLAEALQVAEIATPTPELAHRALVALTERLFAAMHTLAACRRSAGLDCRLSQLPERLASMARGPAVDADLVDACRYRFEQLAAAEVPFQECIEAVVRMARGVQ